MRFNKSAFKALLVLISSFVSLAAFAQNGTIRGFVYDKSNGEPVIFTNVYLEGTNYGVATDVNGYYSLNKIPAGKYKLTVYTIGYEKYQEAVEITGDKIINQKIYLLPGAKEVRTVEINADRQEAKTDVKISVAKVTPKDIKALPSVGGEPDIAQYLQVLPGVIFTGDQGGQLYVRGGSPIQNKVMLDGMVVYNPFHSIGLYSVFDTDIMKNADIFTGGFGAKYGGRVSSVMDVTTRDGNKKFLSGKVSLSPFGAKTLLEGPLMKMNDDGGSISFIVSARNSYLKQTSKIFYNYVNNNGTGLPFNFSDLYGKVSMNSGNGSKFNVFGFNFTDRVKYQGISDLGWDNFGIGSSFVLVPASNPVLIEGNFSYSKYTIGLSEPDVDQNRSSEIGGFNLGLDFTYYKKSDEIKYGVQVLGFSTNFLFDKGSGVKVEQDENTTELAGYFSYKMVKGLLVLEPSFRYHYYASLSEGSPEPRLGLKYNISEYIRFKAAGGMYSQNLISANSDRDVVNLFYGFLSGPENLPRTYTTPDGTLKQTESKLQKATHYVAGFEFDITPKINVNVEAYYKKFDQLTNTNRNKIYNDDPSTSNQPDVYKKDFIIEVGDARGLDFVVKYTLKNANLYAVYSLSRTTRFDGFQEYFPVFDRRHNVNLVANYGFGKNNSWEASARWNLGSGFPFTQTSGFLQKYTFNGGITTDINNSAGSLGTLYGDYNAARLPYYHRMDVSIKKIIKFKERTTLEVGASVSNAYNRENIFYINRVTNSKVFQLPILPSINMSLVF